MKKQLLTAAVAAAVALPMIAQAGVYGRTDGVIRMMDTGARDFWEIGVDKMRWGIVGSEDLGNGMKALYHYEWAMGNAGTAGSTFENETTRLAYVGLEGGFGKVTLGRNWWPSYFSVWGKTDFGDAHANGPTNLSGNRIGRQIAYTSPNFSGFTVSAAGVMSDETGAQAEDGVDIWELVGDYKNGPLQVGVTFRNDQRDTLTCAPTCSDTDVWGIGGSYAFGDLTVEGHYGNSDPGNNAAETDVYALGATFAMGPNQIYGAYRNAEVDNNGPETDDWFIGFRHFMSKETRLFIEWRTTEVDTAGVDTETDDMLGIGMRKDWKL
jgi:predicted porin